jgi:hypothetical protein
MDHAKVMTISLTVFAATILGGYSSANSPPTEPAGATQSVGDPSCPTPERADPRRPARPPATPCSTVKIRLDSA